MTTDGRARHRHAASRRWWRTSASTCLATTAAAFYFAAYPTGAAAVAWSWPRCPAPEVRRCSGDCDADRTVRVDELLRMVGIGLGGTPVSACGAGDGNRDGAITIDELTAGVDAALGGCPPGVDVLLRNGNVFTADPNRPVAEAVAIVKFPFAGFGMITAVGTNDELSGLADAHTQVIDLGGRTVVPGFNDAHVHVLPFLPSPVFDVGLDPSLDEATAALEQIAQHPPTTPTTPLFGIVGPTVLDDPRATRSLLDLVAGEHPVFIEGFTGHGLLFNSAAMDLLGFADNEPDPPGGFFGREPGTDVLNGVAHEYAQFIAERRFIAQQSEVTATAIYRAADRSFVRQGITSVQFMPLQPTGQAKRLLAEANPRVRWRIIRMPMPTDDRWPLDTLSDLDLSHHNVFVSGLKWILDGTPVERLAALRRPYADRSDWSGQINFDPAVIRDMLQQALESSQQPIFHAVGDRTIETLLTAMEAVADAETWRRVRPRIEHGDLLLPDLIERARNLGVVVVQNPLHFDLPDVLAERWDADYLQHAHAVQTLLRESIPLALGSDAPLSPFDNIFLAVTHPANPQEALTREQAVIAHTLGGAYAEGAERYKGQIRRCTLADIAVLSQDIFTVPIEAVPDTESVLTMVGGEIVYRAPSFR